MQKNNFLLKSFYYLVYGAIAFGVFSLLTVSIFILKAKFNPKPSPTPVAKPTEVWVSKEITVCNEIWQQKKLSPKSFFSSQGVEVSDTITRQTGIKTCNDCGCLNGETLYLKVNPEAVSQMSGFKESEVPQEF